MKKLLLLLMVIPALTPLNASLYSSSLPSKDVSEYLEVLKSGRMQLKFESASLRTRSMYMPVIVFETPERLKINTTKTFTAIIEITDKKGNTRYTKEQVLKSSEEFIVDINDLETGEYVINIYLPDGGYFTGNFTIGVF